MSRLAGCFSNLRGNGRKAVVPYIVAGDPSPAITVDTLHRLVAAGASVLEVGVPFSDPMSEGPVIQKGHERALEQGVSLRQVLSMVTEFRQQDSETPIILMGYANPVERMGYADFAQACAAAGVDGLITVDLPPEEVDALNEELKRVAIDNIFLISPTTPPDRVASIVDSASGFIYYVAVKGVTGSGDLDTEAVSAQLADIRKLTSLPLCVGFGIKDAASAAAIAAVADGVVVGSALIDTIVTQTAATGAVADGITSAVNLLADIRKGVDGLGSAA